MSSGGSTLSFRRYISVILGCSLSTGFHYANAVAQSSAALEQPSARTISTEKPTEIFNSSNSYVLPHQQIPTNDLVNLKAALNRFSAASRGTVTFNMTMKVIEALEAPSQEERHARITNLPISVEVMAGRDENGVANLRRNYYYAGVLRATRIINDGTVGVHQSREIATEGQPMSGPYYRPSKESLATVDCTYTGPDGTVWTDPCATQQEIDDAMASLVALDIEMQQVMDELASIAPGYCHMFGGYESALQYPDETDTPCYFPESSLDLMPSHGPFVSSSFSADYSSFTLSSRACIDPSKPCLMEGILAGIGAGAWIGSKYAAYAVMSSATPTTGAVGWAVFGAVTGGFALAGGAASFIQCVRAQ